MSLPLKFVGWRQGQSEAIQEVLSCPRRILVQIVPTGGGKSVGYLAASLLYGGRTVILTSTKGLQDQLSSEFEGLVTVVKGQSAYRCKVNLGSVQHGPCHWGYPCRLKDAGCPYFDQVRLAQHAPIVVTNYSFWFANPETLGDFDLLVCDEAHDAVSHLLESQSVHITRREASPIAAWPKEGGSLNMYLIWACLLKRMVSEKIAGMKRTGNIDSPEAVEMQNLSTKLAKLEGIKGDNWVAEHIGRSICFDPIWPSNMVEPNLFKGIGKILITSATVTRKTMAILGVDHHHYFVTEYPSYFPVDRRLIWYIPTTKVDHRITNEGMSAWSSTIDNIIRTRLHEKGIIHAVSYERARRVINSSHHRDCMISHDKQNTKAMVDRFKSSEPPSILVSPSMVTGWDFPYDQCRWQIIGKVPFPDGRSKVAVARNKIDPDYGCYQAMQALIQACGRGVRAEDDFCETFIIDDHWEWFRDKYKVMMPKWFKDSTRVSRIIPVAK